MSDERQVMILAEESHWHTPESVPTDADCGCRCWINPESLVHKQNNPEIHTSCLSCSGLTVADLLGDLGDKAPTVRAIPGQRAVLNRLLGKKETARAFKRLRIEES